MYILSHFTIKATASDVYFKHFSVISTDFPENFVSESAVSVEFKHSWTISDSFAG